MSADLPSFEQKIVLPGQLSERIALLPRPLVFTNGCFDILHRGHVTYLAQARALGASLIVAANTDASVKRLGKGDDRPLNSLDDRMALLASLECVTLVTSFDEDYSASWSATPMCWSKAVTGQSTRSSATAKSSPGAAKCTRFRFDMRVQPPRWSTKFARSDASAQSVGAV